MKLLKGIENDVLVDDLVADLRILNNFCGKVRFISLDEISSRSIEIICSEFKYYRTYKNIVFPDLSITVWKVSPNQLSFKLLNRQSCFFIRTSANQRSRSPWKKILIP